MRKLRGERRRKARRPGRGAATAATTHMEAWVSDPWHPGETRTVAFDFPPHVVKELEQVGDGNAYRGLVRTLGECDLEELLIEAGQGPPGRP